MAYVAGTGSGHRSVLRWPKTDQLAVSATVTPILRPGNLDRHPVPSEAEDVRSAAAGKVLLEHGRPGFELATTLLAPVD